MSDQQALDAFGFDMRWRFALDGRDEIVHEMDLFPTIARIAGGKVPLDRVIDGVAILYLSVDQFEGGIPVLCLQSKR